MEKLKKIRNDSEKLFCFIYGFTICPNMRICRIATCKWKRVGFKANTERSFDSNAVKLFLLHLNAKLEMVS